MRVHVAQDQAVRRAAGGQGQHDLGPVAMAQGFDEDEARDMVLGTIGGAIAMASEAGAPSLEELRNSVTSKGGTTAAGLNALNGDGGLSTRLHDTLQAAYDRAVELR